MVDESFANQLVRPRYLVPGNNPLMILSHSDMPITDPGQFGPTLQDFIRTGLE